LKKQLNDMGGMKEMDGMKGMDHGDMKPETGNATHARMISASAGEHDLAGTGDHFEKHEGIFGLRYLLPFNVTSRAAHLLYSGNGDCGALAIGPDAGRSQPQPDMAPRG